MSVTSEQILNALRTVQEPELHKDLVTLNMVRDLTCENGNVQFTIMLTTPACPLRDQIKEDAVKPSLSLPGVKNVEVKLCAEVNRDSRLNQAQALPAGIRNVHRGGQRQRRGGKKHHRGQFGRRFAPQRARASACWMRISTAPTSR